MSDWIMYALLVFYVCILAVAAWERNWWRCLYFLGAIMISIAVLGMTTRTRVSHGRTNAPANVERRN